MMLQALPADLCMLGDVECLVTRDARLPVVPMPVDCRFVADTCECLLSRSDLAEDDPVIGCGVGRFLVRRLAKRLDCPYVDFCTLLETTTDGASPDVADCAPAAAVAFLAAEMDAR